MQEQFATGTPNEPGATEAHEPTAGASAAPASTDQAPAAGLPKHLLPPVPKTVDQLLVDILTTKRPDGTASEVDFVTKWLVGQIASLGYAPMWKAENLVAVVPVPGQEGLPPTLFSCHTDTVHRTGGTQQVAYDQNLGLIFLDGPKHTHECLGADDGVGVWLMLRMMQAGVPGAYVFHRGEERGCMGSRKMATEHAEWLKKFSFAVAFDRPNNFEVITHQQAGRRLASDEYGSALATAFNNLSGGTLHYRTSQLGVVTDTAMYGALIPECVNIGVGYRSQHFSTEELDYGHAAALLEVCKVVNWGSLPVKRKPEERVIPRYQGSQDIRGYQGGKGYQGSMFPPAGAKEFGGPRPVDVSGKGKGKGKGKQSRGVSGASWSMGQAPEVSLADEIEDMTHPELLSSIEDDPKMAARWIAELVADLRAAEARFKSLRAAWLSSEDSVGGFYGY